MMFVFDLRFNSFNWIVVTNYKKNKDVAAAAEQLFYIHY